MALDIRLHMKLHRPEVLHKVRDIPNPYDYSTHRLEPRDFVGRAKYLAQFTRLLNDYRQTQRLKNVAIIGNKSYGKSTLLNRFKQILQNYSFVTYETELYRNSPSPVDEYDFIKDVISHIYANFAPIPDTCLDVMQQQIWYSLTLQGFKHDSEFVERKIGFATFYSNARQGNRQRLPYDILERDFMNIVEALTGGGTYNGFAILIDEFQELYHNTTLLDMLRKMSDSIPNLMIIGAGLPLSLSNSSFDKFIRTSLPIYLDKLEEMETLELIFSPIENRASLSRFEVQDIFEERSISEIVTRSGGNPLDVKILCSKMFDHFLSNSDSKLLAINLDVMKEAMDYYASVSEKSLRIKNALETSTREQLSIFKKLYFYECCNLRSIILLQLAFGPLEDARERMMRDDIISNLAAIYEFGLFELKGNVTNISELNNLSPVALSQVSYCFIGDTIDKLYTSYFYEALTKERLHHNQNTNFEDMLTSKLANVIADAVKHKENLSSDSSSLNFTRIDVGVLHTTFDCEEVEKDYCALSRIRADSNLNDKDIDEIRRIANKYDLSFPASIAESFELDGFFVLVSKLSVKGKNRVISTFFPVKSQRENSDRISKQIIDHASCLNYNLSDHMVSVDICVLYWLSRDALSNVKHVDVNGELSILRAKAKQRDFRGAHDSAKLLLSRGFKITTDGVAVHGDWFNNYGFCLINVGDIVFAKRIFEDLKDKHLIAAINLAYVLLLEGDWRASRDRLKGIIKKIERDDTNCFMLHLAIMHPELPNENKIADQTSIINVVYWNLALIAAKYDKNMSAANAFLKKVKLINVDDNLINKRVRNWLQYFCDNRKEALLGAQKMISNCDSKSLIYLDLQKDIEIFSS